MEEDILELLAKGGRPSQVVGASIGEVVRRFSTGNMARPRDALSKELLGNGKHTGAVSDNTKVAELSEGTLKA